MFRRIVTIRRHRVDVNARKRFQKRACLLPRLSSLKYSRAAFNYSAQPAGSTETRRLPLALAHSVLWSRTILGMRVFLSFPTLQSLIAKHRGSRNFRFCWKVNEKSQRSKCIIRANIGRQKSTLDERASPTK